LNRRTDDTSERSARIAEIRKRLYEIHSIRRNRELTATEAYEYQRLNDELRQLRDELGVGLER
jgi:hypothetical protein